MTDEERASALWEQIKPFPDRRLDYVYDRAEKVAAIIRELIKLSMAGTDTCEMDQFHRWYGAMLTRKPKLKIGEAKKENQLREAQAQMQVKSSALVANLRCFPDRYEPGTNKPTDPRLDAAIRADVGFRRDTQGKKPKTALERRENDWHTKEEPKARAIRRSAEAFGISPAAVIDAIDRDRARHDPKEEKKRSELKKRNAAKARKKRAKARNQPITI